MAKIRRFESNTEKWDTCKYIEIDENGKLWFIYYNDDRREYQNTITNIERNLRAGTWKEIVVLEPEPQEEWDGETSIGYYET